MFIHIGGRALVSDRKIVGIFNIETLRKSHENSYHLTGAAYDDRTVVISVKNERLFSIVSPFTVIKRGIEDEDFFWRKRNEQ